MISNNKKEILDKVDEIVEDVKEVKSKVKDLTDRVDAQEATNTNVNEKIVLLQSQISSLKEMSGGADLETRQVSPINKQGRSYATVAAVTTPRAAEREYVTPPTDPIQSDHDIQVTEIIDLARRTVGLHKIDNDDLKRMRLEHFGGATTEDEEKQLEESWSTKIEAPKKLCPKSLVKIGSVRSKIMLIWTNVPRRNGDS